jgi:O-antigen ligase
MPSILDKTGQIDYFGRLTWGNFFDWLITLCLGCIIVLFTVSLGGVRADTHVLLLPLFVVLLILHGIWLAVDNETPKRLSQVPLFFVPFLIWAVVNVYWISPVAWLGRIQLIYGLEAFLFFWVLVNNVRTRAHLWVMIVLALSPAAYAVFIGFFQFFQNPNKIASSLADHSIQLSPEFFGKASGSFADPNSFAVFLLVGLPSLLIAAAVPRLPTILRVLCAYVASMFLVAVSLTQLFWPILVLVGIIVVVPFMSFKGWRQRIYLPIVGVVALAVVVAAMTFFHPKFSKSFERAISPDGEGMRLDLWSGASKLFMESPLVGVGGGAFAVAFDQSADFDFTKLAQTPHNDFLLLLVEYGAFGFFLLVGPLAWILLQSVRRWKLEPSRAKLKGQKGSVMPPQKFFLSVGLASFMVFLICAGFSFIIYVPALLLYGVFFFAILVKSSTNRIIKLPHASFMRITYAIMGCGLALFFYADSVPRLQAHAKELEMRQRLNHLVEQRVHVSGNQNLLNDMIAELEEAAVLDPTNTDVWIGLSAAQAQRFYQNPADFRNISSVAIESAKHATELSSEYSLAWAQLGVAYALSGAPNLAEPTFKRALEMAPNSSLIHYYWAAYLSHFPEMREEALQSVNDALEINSDNMAARRLQQKLLIL